MRKVGPVSRATLFTLIRTRTFFVLFYGRSETLDKIGSDTSPFFLLVLKCLCDTPSPPINVDCYVLLVAAKFSNGSVTFISTLIGGEEGQMMKFVFLDVHFDIVEG